MGKLQEQLFQVQLIKAPYSIKFFNQVKSVFYNKINCLMCEKSSLNAHRLHDDLINVQSSASDFKRVVVYKLKKEILILKKNKCVASFKNPTLRLASDCMLIRSTQIRCAIRSFFFRTPSHSYLGYGTPKTAKM